MKKPQIPHNETQRLMTLRSLDILDTLPEERFDRITRLARRIFGVPIALVSLIDEDRQWFKSRQGIDSVETPRETSFCAHAVAADDVLVVPDAALDDRFVDNPNVIGDPHVRFYAGWPLRSGDAAIGTLCLIDRTPRELDADDMSALRDLAGMVEDEIRSAQAATTDTLTGLSNRRGFEMLAGKSLAVTQRVGAPCSLLLFDLDGFKAINDQLGHATGDAALVDFARALLRSFRDADVLARLGGDEFCVMATGKAADMTAPLERLEANLAALAQRAYQVRFSVGISEHITGQTLDALIAAADAAMYERKRARKK